MTRYRLDDLGWFHFEKLVQSLLKAELGISVESWGGRGDAGRDAYVKGQLAFPDREHLSPGPFVFQVKFISAANAAGARWKGLLRSGWNAELREIEKRVSAGAWEEAAHYVLLTNAPLTPGVRKELTEAAARVMHQTEVTSLGGDDISDLLDAHKEIRWTFPEVLSLRDLESMLRAVVNQSVLNRSRLAVEESRGLVPVFVPTQAYFQAVQVLRVHSFVVLDGPPEMGKTAIARMIGLQHLLHDWQCIDCRSPEDFFSAYSRSANQLLIADDAFGRTEYDPGLGRLWERDLPRILASLDGKHRLLWTTRKHILARALKEMDLVGRAQAFPEPGEVIVTADALTTEEKARILYRHARAAHLDSGCRSIARNNAAGIVGNKHFTPERIRRFVSERLPEISAAAEAGGDEEWLKAEVVEAIRNPTERMRKSFRALPVPHKWALITLLELPFFVDEEGWRTRFEAHRGPISEIRFRETIEDLQQAFIKKIQVRFDWIHPSYRDLVIDELAADLPLQQDFLARTSVEGIKLALSEAGGGGGSRLRPLVGSSESWELIRRRCSKIAASGRDREATAVLQILLDAVHSDESASQVQELRELLAECCSATVHAWDARGTEIQSEALRTYVRAAQQFAGEAPYPRLEPTWFAAAALLREDLDAETLPDSSLVERWRRVIEYAEAIEPDLASSTEFVTVNAECTDRMFALVEKETRSDLLTADPMILEQVADHYSDLAHILSGLDSSSERGALLSELEDQADRLREDLPDPGDDWEPDMGGFGGSGRGAFDIGDLFSDL